MMCAECGEPTGTGEDCPECQVTAAEMGEARFQVGDEVTVTLPPEIAPWWDEEAYGATWEAEVVYVNGDSLDVTTPTGDIEPVDADLCRLSTSCAEGSPVRTSPSRAFRADRAKVRAWMARSRASGMNTRGSSTRSARGGLSSRTSPPSGQTDLTAYSGPLPAWGTMRSGVCSALIGSEPPTSAHAYSWSPGLPVRVDPGKGSPGRSSSATLGAVLSTSGVHARILTFDREEIEVPIAHLLPLWPTLTKKGDGGNTGGPAQFGRNSLALNALLHGAVSPELAEWIMGFPTGWTGSEHWGTQLSLIAPRSSGT